jgi:LPS-assembly protein
MWDSTTTPSTEADEPAPVASNDANGIPNASAEAADAPTRNRSRHVDPCAATVEPPQREWFSWQLAQKHFFDPTFGGAVITTRRNLFDSTLNFSGIAFLTEPRQISPLISRMRFRTASHVDVGWDFDYDTGALKFNSSNIFLEAHEGPVFGGFSFARLNAPGRFFTEVLDTNQVSTSLVGSNTSDFSQMRVLLGYGNPAKPGLSLAGNTGLDLKLGSIQYATIQAGYNWNCCGIAVEYRKFELGSVRNENAYRFSFTLANIGTAGNLRRAERLF